jgi:hypothetical protein
LQVASLVKKRSAVSTALTKHPTAFLRGRAVERRAGAYHSPIAIARCEVLLRLFAAGTATATALKVTVVLINSSSKSVPVQG